jgi:hypothetical protein
MSPLTTASGTAMRRLLLAIASLATAVLIGGCVAYPYGYPVAGPSTFDRSWDAALGAATDSGVQVTSADRPSGRIVGSKAGAAVTITLLTQADGSVRVSFDAPHAQESNPSLSERWTANYQRRMGR